MYSDNKHIIPFPLPEHLFIFISERLSSPVKCLDEQLNIKYFYIKNKRSLSKYILKHLEFSCSKPVISNSERCISFSDTIRVQDKTLVEGRFEYLFFSNNSIAEMTNFFEELFRESLIDFITGSNFGASYKKGPRRFALVTFLEKYNLHGDKLAFEKYKKHYERYKKRCN